MNTDEQAKIESWLARMERGPSVLCEIARLAHRGQRAEREVCGRCERQEPAYDGKGHYCYVISGKVVAGDFCCRWRSRERGKE